MACQMYSVTETTRGMDSVVQTSPRVEAVDLLRYSCLAVLLSLSLFVEVGRRLYPKRRRQLFKNSFYATAAVSGITLTYATEVTLNLVGGSSNPQSDSTYLLSQILIWAVTLAGGPNPQLCIVNAPALLVFDIAIAFNRPQCSTTTTLWIIGLHRVLALLTLILSCTKPHFLGAVAAPIVDVPCPAEEESTDGDDEGDKWLKQKQKERFERSGGWWEYFKAYSIIIPYVFPRKDRRLQIYFVILMALLLVGRALGLLIQRQLGIVTDALINGQDDLPYKEILVWMVLRYLQSSAGISFVRQWLSAHAGSFSHRQITQAAFNHIMSLSIDFHNSSDSVELIRAVKDGSRIGNILELVAFDFIPDMADAIIAFAYLNNMFGFYVTFTACLAGIVYSSASVKITSYSNKATTALVKLAVEESGAINQAIQGWQTVSSFNRADFESKRVKNAVEALQQAEWQAVKVSTAGGALESLITNLAFFAVIFIAALKISDKQVPMGSFMILISYWDSLINPLVSATSYTRFVLRELLSIERLLLLLQTKPTVTDKADAEALTATSGSVSFKDVHFSYDPRKKTLNGIDFSVKPGQTVALVGETGAGKSTILKLLYRFYDIDSGSITIDDQDISNVTLSSLRDTLGIVDQQPYLFNVSIMENLRYARLDASDEEVYDACKAAAIHDKILTFPDGYKSVVGNRGLKLSGGELQRVAIARVLLKDARIVLLDEATSSVDTDTEVLIQDAVRRLTQGRTTFVIAHRLSTIVSTDQVLVFQDGEIIQRGTHAELARADGKYKSLWSKQVAATASGG